MEVVPWERKLVAGQIREARVIPPKTEGQEEEELGQEKEDRQELRNPPGPHPLALSRSSPGALPRSSGTRSSPRLPQELPRTLPRSFPMSPHSRTARRSRWRPAAAPRREAHGLGVLAVHPAGLAALRVKSSPDAKACTLTRVPNPNPLLVRLLVAVLPHLAAATYQWTPY